MIFPMDSYKSVPAAERKVGFSLIEVVVACFLLGLLVVASFVAVTTVTHSARIMSQRVGAQGMCTSLFEMMKGLPFDSLSSGYADASSYSDDFAGLKAQDILAKGLGPGTLNVELVYTVEGGDGAPNRKNVRITCSWEFTDKVWGRSNGRVRHSETLEGVLTDRYSTSTERMVLNVSGFKLNPNCDLTPGQESYTLPTKLRIVDTAGNIWTHSDLVSGGLAGRTLNARYVEIFPGGGGEQKSLYSDFPKLVVNNSKTYSYYSMEDSSPISVTISSKDASGVYKMSMSCDDATVNIE